MHLARENLGKNPHALMYLLIVYRFDVVEFKELREMGRILMAKRALHIYTVSVAA